MHERWRPIAERIEEFFRDTTVAYLIVRGFSFPSELTLAALTAVPAFTAVDA